MDRSRALSWLYIASLMAAMAFSIFQATPQPLDDHFLYQQFIEALAQGNINLTIPGFHGSDFFALPWYLLSRSPIAQIHVLQLWCVLLPFLGYLVGRNLFEGTQVESARLPDGQGKCPPAGRAGKVESSDKSSSTRDASITFNFQLSTFNLSEFYGLTLATIIAMMPFISFVSMRGWTGPAYWGLMLLTIYLATKKTPFAGIPWALAMLTKPFAVILAPLLFVVAPQKGTAWKKYGWAMLGIGIVAAYFLLQLFQAGRIFVGTHTDLTATSTIQGPVRILLNLAHSLQILFSVHNYYFPNPSLTGPGNMMHTTPILIFLGLFGLLGMRELYGRKWMAPALLGGAIFGILMNALLDHMDHFYMEASVLLLILASLPMLKRFPVWIPIALATLHFQWFYFYLQYRPGFHLGYWFFTVPLLVDAAFVLYVAFHANTMWGMIRSLFQSENRG